MKIANTDSAFFQWGLDSHQSSNIRAFTGPSIRLLISDSKWPGSESVKLRLDELCRLERWDGYQCQPVSFQNANFALQVLSRICAVDTPPPQIVPGTDGDLQIEWHTQEADIELHVRKPNDVSAWRHVVGKGDDEEAELTNDFALIRDWVHNLLELPRAAKSTAA